MKEEEEEGRIFLLSPAPPNRHHLSASHCEEVLQEMEKPKCLFCILKGKNKTAGTFSLLHFPLS